LEQALRVVLRVEGDEVDIPAQGFFEQFQDQPLGTRIGQRGHGLNEHVRQVETPASDDVGFEEREGRKTLLQVAPELTSDLMVDQFGKAPRVAAFPSAVRPRITLALEVPGQLRMTGEVGVGNNGDRHRSS
jgi:hypothetical protein